MQMKANCEKCNTFLAMDGEAFVCSYECTFCGSCAAGMQFVCPNCNGELLKRPKRKAPA
jgi:uncharacterized protein